MSGNLLGLGMSNWLHEEVRRSYTNFIVGKIGSVGLYSLDFCGVPWHKELSWFIGRND